MPRPRGAWKYEEDMNNGTSEPAPDRNSVTIALPRARATCKKRYGRASLTIRRWGGLGSLISESDLVKKLDGYRAGETSAEDVAWACVRERVEKHSPTFSWRKADLERLIVLVSECSGSPHIEARTPEELAEALVKAQDDEREQMRKLAQQLSRSMAGVANVSRLFAQSPLTQWAEQQQRTMRILSRSFAPPAFGKQFSSAFIAPRFTEQLRALGLTESARRSMFPVLEGAIARSIPTPSYASLFAQRFRLPDATYGVVSKSLALYRTQTLTPTLDALARSQTFTIQQVMSAAREAAELAERDGEHAAAVEIETVTAEVVEIVENPSVERLEQIVADLSDRLEEHFATVEDRFDDTEDARERDREERERQRHADLAFNVYLFLLTIYFSYFLWLLDHLPKSK